MLEEAFYDWRCQVVALDVDRTFWEKATILHSEFHRPADKPTPDRFSRHYADTVALAKDRAASTAVGQDDLRDRVVAWKSRFFGSAWARYDLARPDTFRLVPPKEREAALRQDYAAMRDMYLSEPEPSTTSSALCPTWSGASILRRADARLWPSRHRLTPKRSSRQLDWTCAVQRENRRLREEPHQLLRRLGFGPSRIPDWP